LELSLVDEPSGEKLANIIFATIQDRRGRNLLSVRDQNTVAPLRQKRVMMLVQLFLIHRYKANSVHYLTPTEDNQFQTQKMKSMGIFSDVQTEVGRIIVADVNKQVVDELLKPDRVALLELIRKTSPPAVPSSAVAHR
jgi:isocitrate lyase